MTLISFITLTLIALANLVLAFKTFNRLKKIDALGRREQLLNKISELTKINSDGHMIAARFSNAKITKGFITVTNEAIAKDLKNQVARINEIENTIDDQRAVWEKEIQEIYLGCINLPPKTDPAVIERQITLVQFASDNIKQRYAAYLGFLHTLENANPLQKEVTDDMAKLEKLKVELDSLMKKLSEISGKT